MALDVPSDAMMADFTRVRDDNSEEVGNLARRVTQPNKGKSIKQSTSIRLNEEPVSRQRFEQLAHIILQAMGSKIHEPTLPPNTQDAPPTQAEKQIVPHPEVPKVMNKGRIRWVPISNHNPHPVRRSPTRPLAIRAVVGVPNRTWKLMRIFAIR